MASSSGSADASKEASKPAAPNEPHRLLAACSYLGVLFLIPLLVEKEDAFVKFHLRQGIALFSIGVIASFGFHYRSGGSMLMFAVVVISLVAAIRAFNNEKWTLPIIGKYAAKIDL
jgi:fumarate reductase subunit D